MKVVTTPRAIVDVTTKSIALGGGGEGGQEQIQWYKDTSNETATKDTVAEVGESRPLLAPPPQPLQPQRSLPQPSRAPPRRVDHTYRDYSSFPLVELPAGRRAPTNFPNKLHQILSSPDYSHIISWMPHGRAWRIHNKELLMSEVIPKYFVQSKYESFTRQLNGWGFKRLHQSGNDFNAHYHDCFLRGLLHLTVLMKRVPPNQGKLLPHVEGEPNFYEIDKQFPLPLPQAVPYPGHYNYSSSRMSSAGYGAALPEVPEPPPHNRDHYYAPYPSSYPPPTPYYAGHHGGHPPAVVDYAPPPHPEYPPHYPYYPPTQGGGQSTAHEHYHHCPYPRGPPPGGAQSYYETPPLNDAANAEKSEEVPMTAPKVLANQDWVPTEHEVTGGPLEQLNVLREPHVDVLLKNMSNSEENYVQSQ